MTGTAAEIEVRPLRTLAGLDRLWLDLEARADGSFFQSWAWTGCLAEERFPDPWLLSATRGGRIVALALFNRAAGGWRARRLYLGESGQPALDCVFIEHNGILVDRDEPPSLNVSCLDALSADRDPALHRAEWRLSGVPATALAALQACRTVRILSRRPDPFLDFAALHRPDLPVLDNLSANARQQMRRSLRACAAIGPLTLDAAQSADEAHGFLDGLEALHQPYWIGRGKPGAFAPPFFGRFHHALIGRAWGQRKVDLLRIRAGDRVLGYLYNFLWRGCVSAYQSGFDFGEDAGTLRPGAVAHLLAIEHYRRAGYEVYDFLGGEAPYKRRFSNLERELLWLSARPRWLGRLAGSARTAS